MLFRFFKHWREGTLSAVILQTLRLPNRVLNADRYHGEIASSYLANRTGEGKWQRENDVLEQLLSDSSEGSSVLDVPFGTGRFVELYLAKKMRVSGLDISPDMLAAAKQALGDTFDRCDTAVGSADRLPYEDKSFDLIVSCRFFSLVTHEMAKRILAEFRRVGRSRIILTIRIRANRRVCLRDVYDRVLSMLGREPCWKKNMNGKISEENMLELFRASQLGVVAEHVVEEDARTRLLFYVLDIPE